MTLCYEETDLLGGFKLLALDWNGKIFGNIWCLVSVWRLLRKLLNEEGTLDSSSRAIAEDCMQKTVDLPFASYT